MALSDTIKRKIYKGHRLTSEDNEFNTSGVSLDTMFDRFNINNTAQYQPTKDYNPTWEGPETRSLSYLDPSTNEYVGNMWTDYNYNSLLDDNEDDEFGNWLKQYQGFGN